MEALVKQNLSKVSYGKIKILNTTLILIIQALSPSLNKWPPEVTASILLFFSYSFDLSTHVLLNYLHTNIKKMACPKTFEYDTVQELMRNFKGAGKSKKVGQKPSANYVTVNG